MPKDRSRDSVKWPFRSSKTAASAHDRVKATISGENGPLPEPETCMKQNIKRCFRSWNIRLTLQKSHLFDLPGTQSDTRFLFISSDVDTCHESSCHRDLYYFSFAAMSFFTKFRTNIAFTFAPYPEESKNQCPILVKYLIGTSNSGCATGYRFWDRFRIALAVRYRYGTLEFQSRLVPKFPSSCLLSHLEAV